MEGKSLALMIGLGCGIPAGLLVIGFFVVLFALGLAEGEGGVRVSNNMEAYAVQYIDSEGLLRPGEEIVAYYDVTISLDGTESAILTNQRLIYHTPVRNSEIPVDRIQSVAISDIPLGELVEVHGSDGSAIVFEIALFNNARLFIDALRDIEARNSAASQIPSQTFPSDVPAAQMPGNLSN